MVDSLDAYGGSEIGSSDVRLYGNGGGNIEGYPMGESLGADRGSEMGSTNGS